MPIAVERWRCQFWADSTTNISERKFPTGTGGIRGVLSLQILGRIEELLIGESKRPDYRLADYFDYVAGTSTGGILAAGIALGMTVAEILEFYVRNGAAMFEKASMLQRLRYEYNSEPLAQQLIPGPCNGDSRAIPQSARV
jgi:patatin-like phospholipase/acyl hydrolase